MSHVGMLVHRALDQSADVKGLYMGDYVLCTAASQPVCRYCTAAPPHGVGPGSGPHNRSLVCRVCQRMLQWLKPPGAGAAWQERLATLPPTPKQLAYLAHLGHTGPVANRREASERISTLEKERRHGS
jgi:hypothetical protein